MPFKSKSDFEIVSTVVIDFAQEICDELFELFSTDKGFDRDVYEKQMSVMRGQVGREVGYHVVACIGYAPAIS